jgi:hypothetical protein
VPRAWKAGGEQPRGRDGPNAPAVARPLIVAPAHPRNRHTEAPARRDRALVCSSKIKQGSPARSRTARSFVAQASLTGALMPILRSVTTPSRGPVIRFRRASKKSGSSVIARSSLAETIGPSSPVRDLPWTRCQLRKSTSFVCLELRFRLRSHASQRGHKSCCRSQALRFPLLGLHSRPPSKHLS